MHRLTATAKLSAAVFAAVLTLPGLAEARGGANFMNSPGYQQRLQESRGFVTSYSNGYPERDPLYDHRNPQSKRQKARALR